jgi:hypothetical protein
MVLSVTALMSNERCDWVGRSEAGQIPRPNDWAALMRVIDLTGAPLERLMLVLSETTEAARWIACKHGV